MSGRATVRRLAVAFFLSGTGSGMAGIALTVDIYARTGSALWLSATYFLTFGVSGLLNPVAGMIADRFDRQRVMVVSDVLGAVVWTTLLLGRGPVWLLTTGFIASLVARPFGLASRAALPNFVDDEDLAWANGTISVAYNLSRILGPVLGGLIAGLASPRWAYGVNAASFIASAAIVTSVSGRFQARDVEHGSETGSIWSGFAVVLGEPALRSLTIVWTVLYLTIDVALVADLPLARAFGWGAFGYGLMNAFYGGGALVGAIAARRLKRHMEPASVLVETLGVGAGYGLVAIAPVFAFVLGGQVVAAGTDAVGEVGGLNILQRRTIDALRGRVFGAVTTLGMASNAIGFTFAGFIVRAVGPRWTYGLCALASIAVAPLLAPLFVESRTSHD
jgi:MFS family permease